MAEERNLRTRGVLWLIVALLIGVFALDLHTPAGYSELMLYLAVLMLTILLPQRWSLQAVAVLAGVLAIVGGLLSSENGMPWGISASLYSRASFLVALAVVAAMVHRVRRTTRELGEAVATRTLELTQAKTQLERELSQRQLGEGELLKLNRTLRALRNSTQAMTHARDEPEYLESVCRMIVNDCGHAMVWIGYADSDEEKSVRPVAYSGFEEGYLETLRLTWADTERGQGPTGTAIRTGQPVICRNMLADPKFAPWREQALKRGYAASIALPFMAEGRTLGALTIYTREPDPFSDAETRLLDELADDLAHGITMLRARMAQAKADAALRRSEERQAILADTAGRLLGSKKPRTIVDELCHTVMEHLECHAFFNFLVDAKAQRLHLNACGGIPAEKAKELEWLDFGVAVCGCAAQQGCRIVAEDIPNTPDPRTQLVGSFGLKAYACHPLQSQGQVIGTLSFGTRTRSFFSEDDLALMKGVTDLVATAMERMRAEEALREREAQLRQTHELLEAVTQGTDVIIAAQDTELRYTYFNSAHAAEIKRQTGKDNYIGARMADLFADMPQQWAVAEREWRTALAGETTNRRIEFGDAKHHRRVYNVLHTPIRDAAGHVIGAGEVAHDVTEQVRAEETLRANEATLRGILDATRESVWLFSPNGRVLMGNAVAFSHFSVPPEAILGKHFTEFLPAHVAGPRLARLQEAVESGRPLEFEDERSEILFRHCFYPVLNAHGQVTSIACFSRDITERRRAETARQKLEEALLKVNANLELQVSERTRELQTTNVKLTEEIQERKRADAERLRVEGIARERERLAMLGELAAGVAHELRNPLQGVMSYMDLVKLEVNGAQTVTPLLRRMEDGLRDMDRVAAQLLDLSRQDRDPAVATVLGSVIEGAWGFLQIPASKQGVTMSLDIEHGLPLVKGNPARLTEAFLNLLKNSLDALGESGAGVPGTIRVAAHLHPRMPGMVEVLIADNGPGIPADIQGKVFQPFFTTKPSGKGTGLGLAMVRKMAESCGGYVELIGSPLPGTTIGLGLPVAKENDVGADATGLIIA